MELLLGGTAQRRRGEVQQDRPDSSSTCLSRGCSGPMMSRASSGRRDTPVIRDRNTRNLGCDKRSVLRPAAASSTSCRHDAARAQIRACKRSRDELLDMKRHGCWWRSTVLAQRQLSIRVIAGRGGEQVKLADLTGFKQSPSADLMSKPSPARRGRRSPREAWIPVSPSSQCGPNVF